MKTKGWFIYCAVVLGIFGLLFTIIPGIALDKFDIILDDAGILMVRLFGAALIGLALIAWLARDDPPSRARTAIIWGQCIESAIAFVVLVIGIINGLGNVLSWIPTILHLSIALGFGYMLATKAGGR